MTPLILRWGIGLASGLAAWILLDLLHRWRDRRIGLALMMEHLGMRPSWRESNYRRRKRIVERSNLLRHGLKNETAIVAFVANSLGLSPNRVHVTSQREQGRVLIRVPSCINMNLIQATRETLAEMMPVHFTTDLDRE